ncbi:hypothetical protein FMM75_17610 [Lachnospiraceae bacterium MD335]|nr:hypothetical protein [Lachnospiraceae bacterium MD335]
MDHMQETELTGKEKAEKWRGYITDLLQEINDLKKLRSIYFFSMGKSGRAAVPDVTQNTAANAQ